MVGARGTIKTLMKSKVQRFVAMITFVAIFLPPRFFNSQAFSSSLLAEEPAYAGIRKSILRLCACQVPLGEETTLAQLTLANNSSDKDRTVCVCKYQ